MPGDPDFWSYSPQEFEAFIANFWERRGYQTTLRSQSRDKGIDVEARKDGRLELIQVKRYNRENKIGSNDVRNYSTLYQQVPEADEVIIVTSSTFTGPAEELGEDLNVTLIDRHGLEKLASQSDVDVSEVSVQRRNSGLQFHQIVGISVLAIIILFVVFVIIIVSILPSIIASAL